MEFRIVRSQYYLAIRKIVQEKRKVFNDPCVFKLRKSSNYPKFLIPALKGWVSLNAPLKGQTTIARRFNGGLTSFERNIEQKKGDSKTALSLKSNRMD